MNIKTWQERPTDFAERCAAIAEAGELRREVARLRSAVASELENNQRVLELQQASYEREIAIEVEAEREACALLCESIHYADLCTPINCANEIRKRSNITTEEI